MKTEAPALFYWWWQIDSFRSTLHFSHFMCLKRGGFLTAPAGPAWIPRSFKDSLLNLSGAHVKWELVGFFSFETVCVLAIKNTKTETVHAEWTCTCNYSLSMNTQSWAIWWGIICLKDHLGTLWPNKNITIHKYRYIYVFLKRNYKQLLDPQRNHFFPSPGNKRTDLCWRKDFYPCCTKHHQDSFPITVLSNCTSSGMD